MKKNQAYLHSFDDKIEALLAKMTLKEKIGQLNQGSSPNNEQKARAQEEMIRRGELGSLILANSSTAGNCEQPEVDVEHYDRLQHIAVEESRLGIPMIFGRDVIHGHHTVFPIPLAGACSFNPELVTKCYRAIADEATAEGIHWTFSPMIDLSRDPRWGRIIESPGEDPYVGARFAEAAIRGFQGDDLSDPRSMAACAKHFLGYGFSEGGRDYNPTDISGYTIHNCVLPAFRAAVDAGCATVMGSFNDVNGQPVASSHTYLTELLRDEMGFEGFVVSDWGSIRQMVREGVARDLKDCAAKALPAGMEMDMDCTCYAAHLENLVNEGIVKKEDIDTAVRRVLRVKFACGLFDRPFSTRRPIDKAAHRKLAREIAGESMLLLKNHDGLLPLAKDSKVILAGAYTEERRALNGSWSSDGHVPDVTTMAEAMREVLGANGGEMKLVENSIIYDNAPEAFKKNQGTIVLALGEGNLVTGEAMSLSRIEITENQVRLAAEAHASGKKVVGVIFGGRPLALEAIEPYLDAILYAWHCGTETAHAACDILFGDVNPSGKSSVTFLRTTGHVPLYYNDLLPAKAIHAYYGDGHGYLDVPGRPMYPFGYGLSYTKFDISAVEVRRGEVSVADLRAGESFELAVKVKNVGDRAGKETVQLYIHDVLASFVRPKKELKGFQKIELAPGEEQEVVFQLGYEQVGFYNERGNYLCEPGDIEVMIGDDCMTTNMGKVKIL